MVALACGLMATQAAAGVGNEAPSGIDDTFRVLDANGTDGNASFMLPTPRAVPSTRSTPGLFWAHTNNGLKLLQLRFYKVAG